MGSNDSIMYIAEMIKTRKDDDVIHMNDEYLYEDIINKNEGANAMQRTTIPVDRELYNQIRKASETGDGTIIFSNGGDILMIEIKKPADKSTSNQKNIVTNWMDDILDIINEAGSTVIDKDDALNRIESYCAAVKTCVTS